MSLANDRAGTVVILSLAKIPVIMASSASFLTRNASVLFARDPFPVGFFYLGFSSFSTTSVDLGNSSELSMMVSTAYISCKIDICMYIDIYILIIPVHTGISNSVFQNTESGYRLLLRTQSFVLYCASLQEMTFSQTIHSSGKRRLF